MNRCRLERTRGSTALAWRFDIDGCDANPAPSSTSCERKGEATTDPASAAANVDIADVSAC